MAFERPELSELVTRVRGDFRSRLKIAGALVRRAMANVLGVVWAGAVHMLHGYLVWLGNQLIADKAEREFLLRQAGMRGITPIPATYASGTLTATGVDGNTIPTGAIYERDDGVTYLVTADATIAGGEATVSVEAVEAGAGGNMDAGDTLTLQSPITGVDSEATVDADADGDGLAGGVDAEDTEGTRERYILDLQEPPEGGADQDYIAWARAVAGVATAWVYRHENGLGTVVVRFLTTDEADPFPDASEVAVVQAKLDAERPTTAEVTAAAPVALPVDFTISITPDNATVRAAVEAELEDLLLREAEPGDGAGRGTILLSQILVAVGVAEGVEDFSLTVPAADVEPGVGELPRKGTVTFA